MVRPDRCEAVVRGDRATPWLAASRSVSPLQGRFHVFLRLAARAVGLAILLCVLPLPAAEQPERYTLFVALHPPYEANRAALRRILAAEGYESSAGGDEELVLVLTAGELSKLFQARVRMRTVAASASDRMVTQPTLESVAIPARFGKLIRSVYFDPQRS